ncbi:MAG TPA: cyclopropane fatty acyl phospholipid synthase [Kofleriaceae bacterium]|nr:cyclopropane fatty acyl phospholipid synthase [Kofleriaceae bacterium]
MMPAALKPARKLLSVLDDKKAGEMCREMLARAGITVGGDAPWDIQVHDERLWARVMREGSLGLGDAYVEGWWDTPALDQAFDRVFRARLDREVTSNWVFVAHVVRARLFNTQALRPFEIAERHYDIGNDLYEAMLDKSMAYTCGYWRDGGDLDQAQEAKLELVCKKLGLRQGMRVLELGCGWGSFAFHAARKHGVSVTAYNVSKEQVAWINARKGDLPIEVRLDDYRKATGTYDAVVSIGLMEHVGPKNYRAYMELVDRCLAPDGVALVHTIASNRERDRIDPWFDRHIFPNAAFPSLGRLTAAVEEILVVEDIHNIGEHYDPTLMAWWQRFDAAWPQLRARYGDTFYRMWKFYLLVSAATFRARYQQLYQIVFTKPGAKHPRGARAV